MKTYFEEKLISLISNSKLSEDEKSFLTNFCNKLSSKDAETICLKIMSLENKDDYMISLIYGTKISEFLEKLEYLDKKTKKDMLQLATSIFGWQSKKLYEDVVSGKITSCEDELDAKKIENDLSNAISLIGGCFSEIISNGASSRDNKKLELLRNKLQNHE